MIKKTKILFFLIISLFVSGALTAANVNEEYIDDKSSNLTVKPYAGLSFIDFSFDKDNEDSISYTSKTNFYYGISLSWKILGISAGLSEPIKEKEFEDGKNEESFDFRFNYYGRRVGADLYIQHRKGLYLDNDGEDESIKEFYEDMTLDHYKLNVYYIFSWETFSMRAAFDGTDIQKKSSSSFLFMTSFGKIDVENSSSLLIDEYQENEDKYYGLKYYSQRYISLSPGYGWTLVFGKRYYFSFIAFFGAGLQNSKYRTDSESFNEWSFVFEPDFRIAGGYSSERFFYGFTILSPMHMATINSSRGSSFLALNALVNIGYRFF